MKLYYGLPLEAYSNSFLTKFDIFYRQLIEDEGGYVSKRVAKKIKDRGGATKWGISLSFLKTVGVDIGDVNNDGVIDEKDIVILTKDQARWLYFKYFWNPLYTEIKNVQLGNRIFNVGVNIGKTKAVKILQHSINKTLDIPLLKTDGIFGRQTLTAVVNINQDKLYREFIIDVEGFYRSLKKPQFINGWLKRLSRLIPKAIVQKIYNWTNKKAS